MSQPSTSSIHGFAPSRHRRFSRSTLPDYPIKVPFRPGMEPDETRRGTSDFTFKSTDDDRQSTTMSVMQDRFYGRPDLMRTTDAKKEYFLESKDFDRIPCFVQKGFFGCGGSTYWFRKDDLEKAALQKHGEDVLKKKRESREKRNEKKRQRSEEARQALKELQTNKKPAKIDGIEVCIIDETEEDQVREKDTKEANLLKKKLLNTSKRALKMYPNGHPMPIAFDVPNVSAGVFAALLDRAGDRELKTFEKKGAYIKHFDKAPSFFNSTREKLCKPYPRDAVAVTMCDGISLTYKPSTKILTFKGHGEITHIPGDVW